MLIYNTFQTNQSPFEMRNSSSPQFDMFGEETPTFRTTMEDGNAQPKSSLNVLGLFSGIGGFELGLQQAGFNVSGLCECEPHAQRVLRKNFPQAPIYPDVRGITAAITEQTGRIDLICGGFPCQDISIAGKNAGIETGERSGLWREFKRIINDIRPKYAVIENVSALLSRGLDVVLSDLAQIGYDATYTTLDTQYFGLPQRRRRVYILGVRDGIPAQADIFRVGERDTPKLRYEMANIEKCRRWDFTKSEGIEYPFAYFTRQRSDQFDTTGVAGTIAKRDYKSFTDLVLDRSGLRRVTPEERLLIQGFPADYWNDCDLTDKEKFTLNGMSVPVVKWLGHQIIHFDNSTHHANS